MDILKINRVSDVTENSGTKTCYGRMRYCEELIDQPVDIVPWSYLWKRGAVQQTKPESEFIPRRLARIDTVYRPALEELGEDRLKSPHGSRPDLLKQFPPAPKFPLLLGALWVGSLSDYTVTLTWTGTTLPDPEEVEVRTYPTIWGWFGWTVDQIMPLAEISKDGRTWTYPCLPDQVMAYVRSKQITAATEMIAVFAPENVDVPEIHITGGSLGTWRKMDVTVEWGLGEDMPTFTGEYSTVLAAAELVAFDAENRRARFLLAYSSVCDTGSNSRLTMWTDRENVGITFAFADLAEGPIYVPNSGICFYETGSYASAEECITEIESTGRKDVLEIYREHAEAESWEEVFDNVRRQSSGFGDGEAPEFPGATTSASFEIDIPDKRWEGMFYTAIEQLLGRHMWGNLSSEVGRVLYTMELLGLHDKCDELYNYFLASPGVKSDGDFSTGEGSLEWAGGMRHDMGYHHEGTHSSTGLLIYAMMQRYLMTGDADWINERLDRLFAAVDWMISESSGYMSYIPNQDELLCYGLLPPEMNGDYGLPSSDWHWYFYLNAYTLQGLNAFARVLRSIGHGAAEHYTEAAHTFETNLLAAVQYHTSTSAVRRKGDGTYMIFTSRMLYDGGMIHYGSPHGRPHFALGIIDLFLGAMPLGAADSLLDANDPIIRGIINGVEEFGADISIASQEAYDHPTADGGVQTVDPGQSKIAVSGFWGSYTNLPKVSYNADIYLRQDDIENFLRYFFNNTMLVVGSNGQFWEHAHPEHYKDCNDSDNGTAAWYALNLRNMLLLEEGDTLWIAKGTPRSWLKQDKKIAVNGAYTSFGELSYTILSNVDSGRITAEIDVPSREDIGKIKLRLRHPMGAAIKDVKVTSGICTADIADDGETVIIAEAEGQIDIEILY